MRKRRTWARSERIRRVMAGKVKPYMRKTADGYKERDVCLFAIYGSDCDNCPCPNCSKSRLSVGIFALCLPVLLIYFQVFLPLIFLSFMWAIGGLYYICTYKHSYWKKEVRGK